MNGVGKIHHVASCQRPIHKTPNFGYKYHRAWSVLTTPWMVPHDSPPTCGEKLLSWKPLSHLAFKILFRVSLYDDMQMTGRWAIASVGLLWTSQVSMRQNPNTFHYWSAWSGTTGHNPFVRDRYRQGLLNLTWRLTFRKRAKWRSSTYTVEN